MCCYRKLTSTVNITHEQWLAFRRIGIGGSDASTILGLNPYNSLFRLYADKKGLIKAVEDNEAMRQGRDLEQYVAERFTEATGKKVKRRNFMFQSIDNPFMLADIDREIIGENAALECKTTSAFAKSDFEIGEIPLTYYVQMMHYMAVMGYDRMYLAVLVLGKAFYWFTVERNEEEISNLILAEKYFWNTYIVADIPPELDGSEATEDTLNEMYPTEKDVENTVYISENLMNEYQQTKKIYDRASANLNAIKNKIQMTLGKCAYGNSSNYNVSWKSQERNTIDSKKLKNIYPKIYKECLKSSKSRVLKITEI